MSMSNFSQFLTQIKSLTNNQKSTFISQSNFSLSIDSESLAGYCFLQFFWIVICFAVNYVSAFFFSWEISSLWKWLIAFFPTTLTATFFILATYTIKRNKFLINNFFDKFIKDIDVFTDILQHMDSCITLDRKDNYQQSRNFIIHTIAEKKVSLSNQDFLKHLDSFCASVISSINHNNKTDMIQKINDMVEQKNQTPSVSAPTIQFFNNNSQK